MSEPTVQQQLDIVTKRMDEMEKEYNIVTKRMDEMKKEYKAAQNTSSSVISTLWDENEALSNNVAVLTEDVSTLVTDHNIFRPFFWPVVRYETLGNYIHGQILNSSITQRNRTINNRLILKVADNDTRSHCFKLWWKIHEFFHDEGKEEDLHLLTEEELGVITNSGELRAAYAWKETLFLTIGKLIHNFIESYNQAYQKQNEMTSNFLNQWRLERNRKAHGAPWFRKPFAEEIKAYMKELKETNAEYIAHQNGFLTWDHSPFQDTSTAISENHKALCSTARCRDFRLEASSVAACITKEVIYQLKFPLQPRQSPRGHGKAHSTKKRKYK
eukprot:CAMPEP_0119554242 /NCGR_PEP_ID=MMETSP1352-20130426/6793_1 /TAXON_ID=265584 /ORGANISM="Stauroneis constricta, Strain CCMP1120" /LENGTH=328 /DNA_ID=CAMNT_0007600807 /DNA_START=236 /DNA_END=1225 /DNA_ORIENTATION=-